MVTFAIDPRKSAVVAVDLQNCCVEKSPIAAPLGLQVVDKLNLLAAHYRAAGSTIIWTRHVVRPDHSDVGILGKTVPPVAQGAIDDGAPSDHGFMGLFPMGGEHFRLIASNPLSEPSKDAEPSLDELQRIYDQRSPIQARFHDLTWSSWFRINSRMGVAIESGSVVAGRRRRPHPLARWCSGHEHGHSGYDQRLLEARDGDEWASASGLARHLRGRPASGHAWRPIQD
jgi:hypothetical protein